ncbi:hypothetical protein Bco22_010970 [Bartonella sp. Coyote22sub2]|nr:hypothetical protein Bho11B_013150 [Bartonella sp. 11B]AQX23386.1 hypothetical protein Bho114_000400 [Bartonella sp. 114]AQX25767.1 hypothetical protein Bco22_010970 [Bartonella sp. Coyote22sub2]
MYYNGSKRESNLSLIMNICFSMIDLIYTVVFVSAFVGKLKKNFLYMKAVFKNGMQWFNRYHF